MPIKFDIQLLVPSTLRVENNLVRMVANADLTLRGTYDRPIVFGHADIERGEVIGHRDVTGSSVVSAARSSSLRAWESLGPEDKVRLVSAIMQLDGADAVESLLKTP